MYFVFVTINFVLTDVNFLFVCNKNRLLCAMAGFKNQSDCSESWQLRRLFLIKAWVNNLALYSQEIIDAKQKIKVNESIASNVTDLLRKIETVTLTLGD